MAQDRVRSLQAFEFCSVRSIGGTLKELKAMLKPSNVPPGRPAQWCGAHKGPGMVDVANRRCEHENCHKVSTVLQPLEIQLLHLGA